MDGQPYSWIDSPGTNLMFRILDPQYTLHTASFYRDLIGKVGLVEKIIGFYSFPITSPLPDLHQVPGEAEGPGEAAQPRLYQRHAGRLERLPPRLHGGHHE